MPESAGSPNLAMTSALCFLMPLAVLIAAVAVLHDAVGDIAACLIGMAAWIGALWVRASLVRLKANSGGQRANQAEPSPPPSALCPPLEPHARVSEQI
jgi:hypothetical protein